MKTIALLQTRMRSSRCPGKAVRFLNGDPLVWHIYRRLLGCHEVDQVVCAIGDIDPEPILKVCDEYGMYWRVGPEKNLLSRLIEAASHHHADAVVRITGDCLFHDPIRVDEQVKAFTDAWPVYAGLANWPRRSVSEGLDCEVYAMSTLVALDHDSFCPREDFATYAIKKGIVDSYVSDHPTVGAEVHMSIDTEEDFTRAEKVLKEIGNGSFRYETALEAWTR